MLNWLRRRSAVPLDDLAFVVYTRRGCHLCDGAWQRLEEARGHHGFSLEAVDVDADPERRAKYGEQVPVVTVNGKVRFKGCVNAVLLQRLLEAESRKRQASAVSRT